MKEIKNLKKAAKRIIKAAQKKENIILFGDADLDGVASVIILKETLQNLGSGQVIVALCDRENEGHGLNPKVLKGYLKQFSPALLVTLDCGIGNFEEIKLANTLGFEVLVADHHEILQKLPQASIIVDPKQPGDKYPFKLFSSAGLTFKLCQEILKDKLNDSLKQSFLELVALATLADMMPEEDENESMINEGLISLENSWRPGIKALFENYEIRESVSTRQAAQKIIYNLNISDLTEHQNETYLLLTSSSPEEVKYLVEELVKKRLQKQAEIKKITEQVESIVSMKQPEAIIFEGSSAWSRTLLGAVSSRVCQKHQKPVFLYKKNEGLSFLVFRAPEGKNGMEAMKKCAKYFTLFGGHPPAGGGSAKNETLEELKACLIEYFEENK